jgi:hypothetical protein
MTDVGEVAATVRRNPFCRNVGQVLGGAGVSTRGVLVETACQ